MVKLRFYKRKSFYVFVSLLFACVFLTSCNEFKSAYSHPAEIISSKERLVISVINTDKEFFSRWNEDPQYNGYILDLIDSLSFDEIKTYAESRYKELSKKNKETNFKASAIYILYCCDTGDVIVKTGDDTRAILDYIYPGDNYRLVSKKYDNATFFLKSLKIFFEATHKGYEQLSFFKKEGLGNSLLSTLNLKLSSIFIPSNAILHKLFFSIPFGIGMIFVRITKSIIWSSIILLLLYFMCRMAYQRHKTRAQKFNIITTCWWSFSVVYFFAFCCVINSLTPSFELMYGLINNNYSDIFYSVYLPYYSSYSTPSVSIFAIILLVILFIVHWFINLVKSYIAKQEAGLADNANDEMSDKVSDLPMTIIALIGGACTCQSSLIYVLITYLFIRVFESIYISLSDNTPHIYSSKSFLLFCLLFILLSLLFTYVKDEHPLSLVIHTHIIMCWSFIAISSVFLLFVALIWSCKEKNISRMFGYFDKQCSFSELINNPIVNTIFSDYALFAGLTAPLFLIGCILFIIYPDTSFASVGFTYSYLVGGFILSPCTPAALFIILSFPNLMKPVIFLDEIYSIDCFFTTKNIYFNKVLDRAWHFGGLVLIVVLISLIITLFI